MLNGKSDNPQGPVLRQETSVYTGASREISRRPTHAVRTGCLWALVTPRVLRRALHGPVYGWTLRKMLQAWGSSISAGSLYPLPSAREREGVLQGYAAHTAGR